jgi:uncharacterized membrane protein YeaQ/YmgE (transglycosylase-associated protein family)
MEQNVGFAVGGVIGILLIALIGLVIGAVAKLLMPGKDPGGWFVTILLGIAGSWVGGFAVKALGVVSVAAELIAAVLGAMLLLFIYRMVKKS